MKKFTHVLIICGGKVACNHPRKQLLKSKKPTEITKAMNEWVESIAHRQILVLLVLPRELRQVEKNVLNKFLEKKSQKHYAKILVEPNYKSSTDHVHYDHHTYNAILSQLVKITNDWDK